MTSKRWLDIVLWGSGDRLDGGGDYKSDLLIVVDALVWIGVIVFLTQYPKLFLTFWIAGPLVGQPVYWIGTQLVIGWVMARNLGKRSKSRAEAKSPSPSSSSSSSPPPSPSSKQPPDGSASPASSEEP